jgi:hypothetical protein
MQETKTCAECKLEITDRVMPEFSICGSDGLDRVNCWQKCWDCELSICKNCTMRHNKCRGTYCKNCFKNHKYIPKEKTQECPNCKETQTLIIYENVCGFDWIPGKLYWIEENGVSLCQTCYDAETLVIEQNKC